MTAPEIVHPVALDQVEPWLRALVTTLLGDPYGEDFDLRVARWRRDWTPERTWGVRDRGRWVATLVTDERLMTVPGVGTSTRDVTVDALTAVTVAGTHRRRGLLRQILTQSLRAAADRGDAMSVLMAAEWPIYGRFGYAPATTSTRYRYRTRRAGASVPGDAGRVRQVDPAELAHIAPEVFAAARALRPGQLDRRPPWWSFRLGVDGLTALPSSRAHWFVHDAEDGGVDGVLCWKVTRDFELTGEHGAVAVPELFATTDAAYRDLWAYLGGLDVIDEVELENRPLDEPARWLMADGRSLEQFDTVDLVWVRLLDVPAALAARGYAVDGRVVLDVVDDDLGGYGAGRFVLEVDGGAAVCTRTTAEPDLRIGQRTLASIYLGGHRLRALEPAGGVQELTPGSAALVDVMFSTPLAPWNQTYF